MNPQLWKPAVSIAGAVCAIVLIVGAIAWWWQKTHPSENVGETTIAEKDPRVGEVPREFVKPKNGIEVLDPSSKGALNLPKDIQANSKKRVIGSAIVKPNPRPQAVIPILNEETGKTEIVTQKMEYPLIALEAQGEVRISYGYKAGNLKVGRVAARYDAIQIMGGNIGVGGSLDTDGSRLVDVGIAWRF